MWPVEPIVKVMIVASIMITLLSIGWILYLISYNGLKPLINKINRENEIIWVRVTKDKLLTFQVLPKGVYGQTKGVMHRKKADVINKGDFPIQCINGNNAILVYDKLSSNINLEHAIAWKEIFKKEKVETGRDAYKKSKKIKIKRRVNA